MKPFDRQLVSRYALLVALTELIPVPIVDSLVADLLRRRLVRIQTADYAPDLGQAHVRMLAASGPTGCLALIWSLVVWPFRKVLRTVLSVLQIRAMVNSLSDVVHRALLLHEAMDQGLDLEHAVEVKAAMQRAMTRVDTRATDLALARVFERSRGEFMRLVIAVYPRIRNETSAEQRHREVSDADTAPLAEAPEAMTAALAEAASLPGVQDELIRAFQVDLADLPRRMPL